jgi:purine-binding chemotaxis protein CheW
MPGKSAKEQKNKHHRLDLASVMPADEFSRNILESRAAILAQVEVDLAAEKKQRTDYIKFLIGSREYYGIPYHDIKDVKLAENITKIPQAAPFIIGVSYWHGKIIPVVDLGMYFGINDNTASQENNFIAAVEHDRLMMGFIFNDVAGVDSYAAGDLNKSISTNHQFKDEYIIGIHAGKTTILNIKAILKDISAELMNKTGK